MGFPYVKNFHAFVVFVSFRGVGVYFKNKRGIFHKDALIKKENDRNLSRSRDETYGYSKLYCSMIFKTLFDVVQCTTEVGTCT